MKKERIIKENIKINENGVEIKRQLIEVYFQFTTGKERTDYYYLTEKINEQQFGYTKFKRLANAEKFIKKYNYL